MLGPVFSGWGVAKWQGTWLWTTHSEVRILPPQLCLAGGTETVRSVTPAAVSHFRRHWEQKSRPFPDKYPGESISVHVRPVGESMSAERGREFVWIRCAGVEVFALVSRDIKHLCVPNAVILE